MQVCDHLIFFILITAPGETIFLVWNSLNDPIFGWLLSSEAHDSGRKNKWNSISGRLWVIKYGGLLWCLSFLVVFFPTPWSFVLSQQIDSTSSTNFINGSLIGMHFIICLCLYDTMLTVVLLAHSALLADITIATEERAKCNMWSSIAGSLGSNSVFIAHLLWDKSDLSNFRIYCIFIACLSYLGFMYTHLVFNRLNPNIYANNNNNHLNNNNNSDEREEDDKKTKNNKIISIKLFMTQIFKWKNFWIFVVVNLVQVFNCHFNSNFLEIFIKYLVGASVNKYVHSCILSLSAILPHFLVVLIAPYISRYGLHFILSSLFIFKILLSLFGYVLGNSFFIDSVDSSWLFFAIYLICNKIFNETICRHGGLVLADLVDEDYVMNKRTISMSSAIFGTNAFFTKPGQSIAPMLGWYLLSLNNYQSVDKTTYSQPTTEFNEFRSMLFSTLILVPIMCGCIQWLFWTQFTLKGTKLHQIKNLRSESEKCHDV